MMERLVCVAIGYLFGLFQTAYIYGKLHGIDIRNYGSGNAGTTNTLRVLGTKAGLIVLAGDILKCILAIAAVRLLFAGGVHEDMYYLLAMYAALGAILGQMDLFSMPVGHRTEMYVIAAFLTAMAYWKHRENIKRLLSGTERKTYLFKKNKEALN